jgi:hypothetical protein
MPVPDFSPGEVLTAAAMDSIGLWLVKTQTISSAATTQDFTACFSSTYSNYRIEFDGFTASAPIAVLIQFLVASTPTTANYYGSGIDVLVGTNVITGASNNNTASGLTQIVGNTNPAGGSLEVYGPNKATRTSYTSAGVDVRAAGAPLRMAAGFQDSNTQFDGFRLLTGSATTITGGTVRVYGYRN